MTHTHIKKISDSVLVELVYSGCASRARFCSISSAVRSNTRTESHTTPVSDTIGLRTMQDSLLEPSFSIVQKIFSLPWSCGAVNRANEVPGHKIHRIDGSSSEAVLSLEDECNASSCTNLHSLPHENMVRPEFE